MNKPNLSTLPTELISLIINRLLPQSSTRSIIKQLHYVLSISSAWRATGLPIVYHTAVCRRRRYTFAHNSTAVNTNGGLGEYVDTFSSDLPHIIDTGRTHLVRALSIVVDNRSAIDPSEVTVLLSRSGFTDAFWPAATRIILATHVGDLHMNEQKSFALSQDRLKEILTSQAPNVKCIQVADLAHSNLVDTAYLRKQPPIHHPESAPFHSTPLHNFDINCSQDSLEYIRQILTDYTADHLRSLKVNEICIETNSLDKIFSGMESRIQLARLNSLSLTYKRNRISHLPTRTLTGELDNRCAPNNIEPYYQMPFTSQMMPSLNSLDITHYPADIMSLMRQTVTPRLEHVSIYTRNVDTLKSLDLGEFSGLQTVQIHVANRFGDCTSEDIASFSTRIVAQKSRVRSLTISLDKDIDGCVEIEDIGASRIHCLSLGFAVSFDSLLHILKQTDVHDLHLDGVVKGVSKSPMVRWAAPKIAATKCDIGGDIISDTLKSLSLRRPMSGSTGLGSKECVGISMIVAKCPNIALLMLEEVSVRRVRWCLEEIARAANTIYDDSMCENLVGPSLLNRIEITT